LEAVTLMAEVIKLHPADDPDEVLKAAIGVYDSVVILGWTKNDTFSGRSTMDLTPGEAILLVELFKAAVLSEAVE
jgi:hypothetical protein